ncbi:MAG TPA: class I SAM-dependent methyltransferase [Candidatus Wunengus sp. YC60]|uniref:class I SAM-dependent methyltransferase n=1 Tax=Candidatus Wunengus sp. YC60 TaxID=3367697 RepID=UPI0040267B3C
MQNKKTQNGIIEAPLKVNQIRRLYNFASHFYSLANLIEGKHHARALELAQIQPNDKVLEVAVGLGYTFLNILKRVNKSNTVYGIDLSPKMLKKTRKLATTNGFSNFILKEGDARKLPYPDEIFDLLYNSYMLDLIPLADIPVILKEFKRVLKKGGRLILLNFSKRDNSPVFAETLYKLNPSLLFGCRPVLAESFVKEVGFKDVKREVPKFFLSLPSEIVTARK